jgi:cellulose synthase/poly-beta-1,6-N-acetylglucosamine synthase-like glycosyltransferase
MATAVLDLDLDDVPSELEGLIAYSKAFILIRYKGAPVGKLTVPVFEGRIYTSEIYQEIIDAVGDNLWQRRLNNFLGWDEGNVNNCPLPKASIAICTRDRPEDLRRCLNALMKLPDDGQEILVIDNCPATSASFEIAKEYPKVRYVREDVPGSSAARNRALYEAEYEIVAFTDDDAVPDTNWLRALLFNFTDPRVICVTGQVMPLELENEAQEWFEKFSPLGRGFKRLTFDGAAFYDLFRVAPIGVSANMALRKQIMERVGVFDEVLGVGTPTRCGEDHELFSRILSRGYKIVYEPEALSWHRHRRTWHETRKTMHGYGTGVYAFWMRSLLVEREFGALFLPWKWFYYTQLPNLIRSLFKRPGSMPIDLILAELRGCLIGVWTYLVSKKQYTLRLKRK